MSDDNLSRRQLFRGLGATFTGGEAARPARLRPTPIDQIVMTADFEANARLTLSSPVFATIASGQRHAFDRITMRPRLMIPTLDMDLGQDLFGARMFAPILIGAVPEQRRYHAEAELATAQGAAGAQAILVVSDRSSTPIEQLAGTGAVLWYQSDLGAAAGEGIRRAIAAGAKAICLELGEQPEPDWPAFERLRQGLAVPVLAHGVISPADAQTALNRGAQGIIVARRGRTAETAPIAALPGIVDAIAGKAPILIDDQFELGVDIMKALALGAAAVLTTRPPMWGLASFGAEGVHTALEILQSELGRAMAMCGNPTLKSLDRTRIRLHAG